MAKRIWSSIIFELSSAFSKRTFRFLKGATVVAVLDGDKSMVRVPLDALDTALDGARLALAEKNALAVELEQMDAEMVALEARLHTRQD